jgi:universal stress protein E
MQKILVATDLSDRSERAWERALLLAEPAGASLLLLHVVDEDQPDPIVRAEIGEVQRYLQAQLQGRDGGRSIEIEVVAGVAHQTIAATAAARGADLVVLGAHRRRLLRDVFVGTTIERVIRAGNHPVLMVNQPARGAYGSAVVGVDFSPASEHALLTAHRLGLLDQTRVAVVHGFLPMGRDMMRYASVEEDRIARHVAVSANEAAAQMSAFLSHPDLAALQPAAFVEDAAPFDAIAGKAQDLAADLVVVGTRGLSGLPRLLLGSVADQVLRTIECDVLAVPPPPSPPSPG